MNRDVDSIREVQQLPKSIEPDRDLWPEIETRIRAEGVRGRVDPGDFRIDGRMMIAVAAVLLVCLATLAGLRGARSPEGEKVAEAPPTGAPVLDRLDAEHAATSQEILATLGRDENLDPETVESIRRNLEIIDHAVREIRDALERDPVNPGLSSLLNAEYQRRGAVLRRAARLQKTI